MRVYDCAAAHLTCGAELMYVDQTMDKSVPLHKSHDYTTEIHNCALLFAILFQK